VTANLPNGEERLYFITVKNVFPSYSDEKKKNAKGNGLPVFTGLEPFPEKRDKKPGCFPSKILVPWTPVYH